MKTFDLFIKNVRIVDGSGSPWFRSCVGIIEDKIAYIGPYKNDFEIKKTIDGEDKILSPGFIDTHTHCDYYLLENPIISSKLIQGVTTIMIGACGISPAPIEEDKIDLLNKYTGFARAGVKADYNWRSYGEYLEELEKRQLGQNVFGLIGQGTIRLAVMGFDQRKPTSEEMEEMRRLTKESMDEGAFGLTTGLVYPPGVYSEPEEIIELAKVLKDYDALYMSHMRNESDFSIEAVKETIDVARKSEIAVQIHHHKLAGVKNHGKSQDTIKLVKEARKNNLDVTIDQYPYDAASTTLRAILPPWVSAEGVPGIIKKLQNPQLREKIKEEILTTENWENFWKNASGAAGIVILDTPKTKDFEGFSLDKIAKTLNKDPLDLAFDIIIKNEGADNCGLFMMNNKDVEYILKQEFTMIGSDSIMPAKGAKTHPRTNGTFPRVISEYVRKRKLLSLETAVFKMTGLAATRFNLRNKGFIKEGMDADLVIFDENTIEDMANFKDPFAKPRGIDYVIVNGKISVEHGDCLNIPAGKVIRK